MTPGADPVHKVTIIPRGMALGLTMQLPTDDKHSYTKEHLEGMLAVLMGGRTAEEMFLGHITTGAGNDIERATDIARNMVCEWGMSELGPLAFGKKEEAIFLGREIAQHRDFSEATAVDIDKEVKRIVNIAYESAKNIQNTHRDVLERIAQGLLERGSAGCHRSAHADSKASRCRKMVRTPPPQPPQGAPATDPQSDAARTSASARIHAGRLASQGVNLDDQNGRNVATRARAIAPPCFLRRRSTISPWD